MIKLSARTKLSTEDAIKRAVSYFGTGGVGLELKEQGVNCVSFTGAAGVVEVTVYAEGKGSTLEVAATEWDSQAKDFVSKLPN